MAKFWEVLTAKGKSLAGGKPVTMQRIDWKIVEAGEDYLELESEEGTKIFLPSTGIHRVSIDERGKVFLNE